MSSPVALVIARKDLRQRLRDRSVIILGFIAPVTIATLMSLAFRGTDQFHTTLGLIDADHGALAKAFRQVLDSPDLRKVVTVKDEADPAAARAAIRGRSITAAFVLPAGFSAAAASAHPTPVGVLTSADNQLAGEVATSITQSFVARLNADRLSVATALAVGSPPDRVSELLAHAAVLRLPIDVRQRPSGDRSLKGISYYAPGMGIFFLLFAIGFTSRSYFVEQRAGTVERITAAVRPGQVLFGKAISAFVYGSASLTTMVVVTTVAFGADWGGLPGYAIGAAMVTAVVALTALVIVVSRTERQAEGISSIVTFGLALLGGNFVFLSVSPPIMRRLALLTPNGWALRAYVDLTTGPRSWGSAAAPLLAIATFTAFVGIVTLMLSRRTGRFG